MKSNDEILAYRRALYDRIQGPRVGDFLRLPRIDERIPEFTRFTHEWDTTLQTGGSRYGGFYLSESYISYSGGLHPGLAKADIVATDETTEGQVWFFDGNIAGAGRGVYFQIPFRIFTVRPGANCSGLHEMETPYRLRYHEAPDSYGYQWSVSRDGSAYKAFKTEDQLTAWLAQERLAIAGDVRQSQRILWPAEVA